MVRDIAVTQATRLVHLVVASTVATAATVGHVMSAVAETVVRGNPLDADAMAGAFDQLSCGEPVELLNSRL